MTAAAQTDANSEHTVFRYLATAIEDGRETARDARAYAKDAGFAAVVALGCVGTMLLAPDGRIGFDALAWVLGLVGSVALVARHRFPRAVLVITAAAMVAYQLRGYPDGSPVLPMLVAVYRSIRGGHRGFFAVTALLSLVVSLGSLPLLPLGDVALRAALEERFLTFGWIVACAMGAAMRIQHEAMLAQAEERAAENAQRSADEERLRIARELHDTLTHSISVIKVQAGVAVHLSKKRGEEPPPALLAIQEASGDAARELRSTLHVLRNADGGAEGVGLERLPELVERARGSGVPATVAVAGERPALPAEVDRAAYRIVQESLTNVARHAGPAAAVGVHVSYAPDKVVVQVDDDGTADPGAPPQPGIGLTGMRERVTALGGELHAAPRPEGGFRVRAELPLPRAGGPAGGGHVIRVLLVDDQALIRGGFRALLDAEDDIEVVGEAADGAEGVRLAARHRPDVALVDVQMPVLDGIEATRRIAADPELADVHVVILTNYGVDEYVWGALRAGAAGFLVKDMEPEDLLHGVRVAARGDALLSPALTRKLIQEYVSRPAGGVPDADDALRELTRREREVVTLVGGGLSNEEIAARLHISPITAKTHVSRSMTKLGARDRAQLVVLAYETGLVTPRGPVAGQPAD